LQDLDDLLNFGKNAKQFLLRCRDVAENSLLFFANLLILGIFPNIQTHKYVLSRQALKEPNINDLGCQPSTASRYVLIAAHMAVAGV